MEASCGSFSIYGQFSNVRSKYYNTVANEFRFNNNIILKKS